MTDKQIRKGLSVGVIAMWIAVTALKICHFPRLDIYFQGTPLTILFGILILITIGVVHHVSPVANEAIASKTSKLE